MKFKLWLEENTPNVLTVQKTPIQNGVYHFTGRNEDISEQEFFNNIDPTRLATKQFKPGREYGGFYVGPLDHAKLYGGTGFKITLKPNANVLYNPEQTIDRVSIKQIQNLQQQNIDVLWGKDIRGKQQGIITNKNAIQNVTRLPNA